VQRPCSVTSIREEMFSLLHFVLSTRPSNPLSPSSLPLFEWGKKVVYNPAENFFPFSIFTHDGGKSCPLSGCGRTAHACFHGEWFTDVYQEWIDQRRPHDRRSIKHQIKDGNPQLNRRTGALWNYIFTRLHRPRWSGKF